RRRPARLRERRAGARPECGIARYPDFRRECDSGTLRPQSDPPPGMNDIAQWIHERVPAGDTLTREQLADLARAVGEVPDLWRRYIRHDPNRRYWHQLYRDPQLDVWLICWDHAQDTGYHDH